MESEINEPIIAKLFKKKRLILFLSPINSISILRRVQTNATHMACFLCWLIPPLFSDLLRLDTRLRDSNPTAKQSGALQLRDMDTANDFISPLLVPLAMYNAIPPCRFLQSTSSSSTSTCLSGWLGLQYENHQLLLLLLLLLLFAQETLRNAFTYDRNLPEPTTTRRHRHLTCVFYRKSCSRRRNSGAFPEGDRERKRTNKRVGLFV